MPPTFGGITQRLRINGKPVVSTAYSWWPAEVVRKASVAGEPWLVADHHPPDDPLTGLPNRQLFRTRLRELLARDAFFAFSGTVLYLINCTLFF